MIRAVRLANWKMHKSFVANLEPGLNFILGKNGRGKTSLIQAMEFALLGEESNVSPIMVGHGADLASAEIELEDGEFARLKHAISRTGAITATITGDGKGRSGTVGGLIGQRFSADPLFLRSLLFLAEGDVYRYGSERNGRFVQQLERLLPLGSVRVLMAAAQKKKTTVAKLQRPLRSTLQASRDQVATLRATRVELERAISAERLRLAKAQEDLSQLREAQEQEIIRRSEAERFRHWLTSWQEFLRGNGRKAEEAPQDALSSLEASLKAAEQDFRSRSDERAAIAGRILQVQEFLRALETSAEKCPLCRQDLDEAHRTEALEQQRDEFDTLRREEAALASRLEDLEPAVASAQSTLRVCQDLIARRPSEPAETSGLSADAKQRLQDGEAELQTVQASLSDLNRQLGQADAELRAAESEQHVAQQVTDAFRDEAVLKIIESGIEGFLREVRSRVLAPLSEELEKQWKGFRPESGWALGVDDDGSLCLTQGASQLPFDAMSGGEKTVALVLWRLALVGALTKADFLVLDEPLEHLDPRNRRLLISSLNQAIQQGIVRQVIMSTYEESLVRRLVLRSSAHAIYLD